MPKFQCCILEIARWLNDFIFTIAIFYFRDGNMLWTFQEPFLEEGIKPPVWEGDYGHATIDLMAMIIGSRFGLTTWCESQRNTISLAIAMCPKMQFSW